VQSDDWPASWLTGLFEQLVVTYTNIDTGTGLQAMTDIFNQYHDKIPLDFTKEFFLTTLEIILMNNMFKFGDMFWQQINGTVMGTLAAPLHSTLTFGSHKKPYS